VLVSSLIFGESRWSSLQQNAVAIAGGDTGGSDGAMQDDLGGGLVNSAQPKED
jgi:hypothetical protein